MDVIEGSETSPNRGDFLTIGISTGCTLGHRELLADAWRTPGSPPAAVALPSLRIPVRFSSQARASTRSPRWGKSLPDGGSRIDVMVVETFTGAIGGMDPEEFAGRSSTSGSAPVRHGWGTTSPSEGTVGSPDAGGSRESGSWWIASAALRGGAIVSSSRIGSSCSRDGAGGRGAPLQAVRGVRTGDPRRRPRAKARYPTANVEFVQELTRAGGVRDRPRRGGVGAERRGQRRFNPTFRENSLAVEAHLLDFVGDLYGQEMSVASGTASGTSGSSRAWRNSYARSRRMSGMRGRRGSRRIRELDDAASGGRKEGGR